MTPKKSTLGNFSRQGLMLGCKLILSLFLLSLVQVSLLIYVDPPFTLEMAIDWTRRTVFNKDYSSPVHIWRPLREISPWLVKAVLAGEDQRFMSHNGFDFIELNKAFEDILVSKRFRGASTITMQVARTVFLWKDRSLVRKIAEAYYTVLVELFWSKTRILEVYLNMVDWGDGVMGAEAASQKYFGLESSHISPSQAAGMASILPNPHLWSPTNPSDYVKERQERILKDMATMHL